MKALDRLEAALAAAHGCDPKHGRSRCPSHDDINPSLSVTQAEDGTVLLHCHAGCSNEVIMAELKLPMSALFELQSSNGKGSKTIVATYDYQDEAGQLVHQTVRYLLKDFRQRRPDGFGGWLWDLKGIKRLLYRLPELLKDIRAERRIFVVEGEKDVDTLRRVGLAATTNPCGALQWRREFNTYLVGVDVIILSDNDDKGANVPNGFVPTWVLLASRCASSSCLISLSTATSPTGSMGATPLRS